MATTITKTVKPSGGDYTSLAAWESANQADIVTSDTIQRVQCYSMEDTAFVTVDGWTTDATRYIIMDTPTSERHNGKWNTTKYRLRFTNLDASFFPFSVVESYTRIDGLQISMEVNGANNDRIALSANEAYVSNNIVRVTAIAGQTGHRGISVNITNANSFAWNNIVYLMGVQVPVGTGISQDASNFTYKSYLYNNTVVGFLNGSTRAAGNPVVCKNELHVQNTVDFNSTFDAICTNNLSQDNTAPGIDSHRMALVQFTDGANEDFHLSFADKGATDQGSDLSADAQNPMTLSIGGFTRAVPWNIGAVENLIVTEDYFPEWSKFPLKGDE